jgi:hypothetical protein
MSPLLNLSAIRDRTAQPVAETAFVPGESAMKLTIEWIAPLATLIVLGLLSALARRPARVGAGDGEKIIQYGGAFRGFAWATLVAIAGGATFLTMTRGIRNQTELMDCLALYPFAALPALLLLESKSRVVLADQSITGYSVWRGSRCLAWKDIQRVEFSPVAQWFVVVGARGQRVRVHTLMTGISDLADAIRARLPFSVYAGAEPYFRQYGG